MKTNLKTFPSGQGKDAVEFSIAVHEWKEAFAKELREKLADAEKSLKCWERGSTEWHATANSHGYFLIKEILGE